MNRGDTYDRVLKTLNTNSTAYLEADFQDDYSEALSLRTLEILRLRGYKEVSATHAYRDFPLMTSLTEGTTGYNGEFMFPSDLLELYRIEVCYNGTDVYPITKENGRLYDIVVNDGSEHNAASIAATFSETNPMATILRGGYSVRPLNTTGTVTNGLHLYYAPRETAVDDDSESPAFEANLHQILIYDVAEMETIAHPEKYANQIPGIVRKRGEVEKAFQNYYRLRLRPSESIQVTRENFA